MPRREEPESNVAVHGAVAEPLGVEWQLEYRRLMRRIGGFGWLLLPFLLSGQMIARGKVDGFLIGFEVCVFAFWLYIGHWGRKILRMFDQLDRVDTYQALKNRKRAERRKRAELRLARIHLKRERTELEQMAGDLLRLRSDLEGGSADT